MSKYEVDFDVNVTETIVIDDASDKEDAIDQAEAQMELLYPTGDGNSVAVTNVREVE